MIPSQMLKGILEGCILTILWREETYGYEISRKLQELGFGQISEGTIYPLLLRLEKNGLLTARLRPSEQGPKRKYYRLSPTGQTEQERFWQAYGELEQAMALLRNPEKGESL